MQRAVLLVVLLCGGKDLEAQELSTPPTLASTIEFVDANPELKTWVESTGAHLQEELAGLIPHIEALDPKEFAGKQSAGTTLDTEQLVRRKEEAKMSVQESSEMAHRYLLAILTVTRAQERPFIVRRILASPTITLGVMAGDTTERTGYAEKTKVTEDGGTRIIHAEKIVLAPRSLLRILFPKTFTHELLHVVIQGGKTNEANTAQIMPLLPTSVRIDLATLRYPMHRYKKYRFVDTSDFVVEGITELLAHRAIEHLGMMSRELSYQPILGTACAGIACDPVLVLEWYAGAISTEEFHTRFTKSIATVLLTNGKFSQEEAARVAFGLANMFLDNRHAKELSQVRGQHAEFATVMHSFIRNLIEAEVHVEDHMRKADLPESASSMLFNK